MSEQFDAVVIGAGIAGETCIRRLHSAGLRVALVERDRIGGECAFWARIPSKTLFGPANESWRAQQIAGIHSPAVGGPRDLIHGDSLNSTSDDRVEAEALQRTGISLIRGDTRVLKPGQIRVADRLLRTPHLIIATGSAPHPPAIDGLAKVAYWTNREALRYQAIPQHVVVLGGEAQAIELAQMFRVYGAEVTLITEASRLIVHEDADIGNHMARHLHESGIRVVLGQTIRQIVQNGDEDYITTLQNGSALHSQALVVAGSRVARTDVLAGGLTGVRTSDRGIQVDEYCRAAEGIWAIGDVTGVSPLSHLAQYQAHLAADDILGQTHPARYLSVPRLYFTEPQVAATGLTLAEVNEQQLEVSSVSVELKAAISHPHAQSTAEEHGKLTLYADRQRGILVGAWAIAPDAGQWIQLAVLAIGAVVPLAILHDTLEQFPGFSEPYRSAIDQLTSALTSTAPREA